jgi:hypothetical protein
LARHAGYGLSKFKLVHSGAMAARYVGKYVAKPDAALAAWPSRTRWAQTWIKKTPRLGAGEWVVERFPRLTTEHAVLASFDALVRWLDAPAPAGVATQGEAWSPPEDEAWAPRPPPRGAPPRLGTFGRIPRATVIVPSES